MIFSTHKNSFRIKKAFEWGIENWLISGGTGNPFQCNVFAKIIVKWAPHLEIWEAHNNH